MLIVIEGVDATGKTTLSDEIARQLAGRRHWEIVQRHHGPPTAPPLEEYELAIDPYRPGTGQHLIIDRLHWGELVYGPLYREPQLSDAAFWHIEQYLRSRGAIMVHATGDRDVIAQRQIDKGEDFLDAKDLTHALNEFAHIVRRSSQDVYDYDSTVADVSATAADLIDLAERAEFRAADVAGDFPSYVGPTVTPPSLLCVGEVPNENDSNRSHAAAFPPYNHASGKYLIDALLTRPLSAGSVGLVNAYDRGFIGIDLAGLWNNLGQPDVVALGRKAEHHLGVMGVPHRATQHPQYRRRFMNDRQLSYAQEIYG